MTQARQQGFVGDYASWWEFTPSTAAAVDDPGNAGGAPLSGSSSGSSARVPGGGGSGGARRVVVRQRVAAYLQPQDPAFFEAGDRPVAVYDYDWLLERL